MNFGQAPGSKTVQKNAYGPGATGRPKGKKTSTSKVSLVPHANEARMPEYLKSAKDLMNTYGTNELPTGLQPRWLLNKKNKNISKGMTGN